MQNEKGLSEESYELAANEYSETIKTLKTKVTETENQLAEMTENTDYVSEKTLKELNTELSLQIKHFIMNMVELVLMMNQFQIYIKKSMTNI